MFRKMHSCFSLWSIFFLQAIPSSAMEQELEIMDKLHSEQDDGRLMKGVNVALGPLSWPLLKELYDWGYKKEVKKMIACVDNVDLYDDNFNASFLHYAAGEGYHEIVTLLLKIGCNVNIPVVGGYYKGSTPLHFTAKYGHLKGVSLLIPNGADVNIENSHGETPLSYAAKSGRVGVVDFLLTHNAQVNRSDEYKMTPLHYACEIGRTPHFSVVKSLLAKGANTECKDIFGKTPLFYAVRRSAKITKFLVDHGADWTCQDMDYVTVLHEALLSHNDESLQILLLSGKINVAVHKYKTNIDSPKKFEILVQKHAKKFYKKIKKLLQVKSIYGKTPFEYIGSLQNKNVVFFLQEFENTNEFKMLDVRIKVIILDNIRKNWKVQLLP